VRVKGQARRLKNQRPCADSSRVKLTLLAPLCAATSILLSATPAHAANVDIAFTGSDGKPLADAVAWLESREARAALRPAQGVEMEQADKRFTQRVAVVPVGSSIQFPNRDKVRHHVYSLSPAKTFELKLYTGTPANPVLFDKPGVAVLGCNIHDNMVAWVVVVESNHHGLSGRDGRIKLADVPPGTYRLRTWHPDLPPGAPALEQPLVVPAAGLSHRAVLPLAGG
jgi:plastocyanin